MSTDHTSAEPHDALDVATQAVEAAADAERAMVIQLLAVWNRSAWKAAGCTGPLAWLRTHTAAGSANARRIVSIVSLCHGHPELADAVRSGELSMSRIGVLARHAAGDRRPFLADSLDAFLTASRNGIGDRQWDHAVLFWAKLADQEVRRPHHGGHALYLTPSLFGGGEIHGRLNESTLHALDAALDAFGTPPDPDGAPYRRTVAERRADALDDLAHFSLSHTCTDDSAESGAASGTDSGSDADADHRPGRADHGPACEGDGMEAEPPFDGIGYRGDTAGDLDAIRARLRERLAHPRRARRASRRRNAAVQVVIDLETLAGRSLDALGDLRDIECRSRSWALGADTARRFLCDARLASTITGGRRHLIDVNTHTRYFTPAQRRALEVRDPCCVFPSCTRPSRWCDIHHLEHHGRGGPTSIENAATLCRFHHTLLHETAWTLTRGPDGTWVATDPAGREWTEPTVSGVTHVGSDPRPSPTVATPSSGRPPEGRGRSPT